MISEDFYSGEPVITGSPPVFSDSNIIGTNVSIDEIEATNNASFGKYNYDPASRQAIYPGGYGYNVVPQPMMQQPIMNPPQPMYGIGAPPQFQYSQYGNVQPTYGYYNPNPVFNGGYGQPVYQQPQVPTTYHIPGVNNSGEYMPPADYEERISSLENEFWTKQMEAEAKSEVNSQNSVYGYGTYGYGYNYYGMPYYNPYTYNNQFNIELQEKVQAMKDEARENRMQFNLNLSRLAHNFVNDGISDDAIKNRYIGRTVDIPQSIIPSPQEYYDQQRLNNMVPFDNSQQYRDHFAAVSREFNEIVGADSNLKDTFLNMGIVQAKWELEDEMHRRKDGSNLYNTSDNSYKYYIKKKAKERYAREKGLLPAQGLLQNGALNTPTQAMQSFINSSPVLSQSTSLSEDGTLNVSINLPCNVGSKMGETYTVYNSQESSYDEKRERFGRFLDSIPGSIYLDNQKQKKIEGYGNG